MAPAPINTPQSRFRSQRTRRRPRCSTGNSPLSDCPRFHGKHDTSFAAAMQSDSDSRGKFLPGFRALYALCWYFSRAAEGFLCDLPLTGPGKLCKLQSNSENCITAKTMKRRVRRKIRQREPRVVKRGAEGPAEHGLGVAPPTAERAQAAPGAPVTARECVGTPRGRLREGARESRWYHGAAARSSLKRTLQGLFCLPRRGPFIFP